MRANSIDGRVQSRCASSLLYVMRHKLLLAPLYQLCCSVVRSFHRQHTPAAPKRTVKKGCPRCCLGRVFDNLSIVLLLPFRYYLNTATLSMESREAAEVALCVLCCPCLHWVLAGFPPCIFLCVPFHFGTHSSTDAANRALFVQCIVKREVSTFKQSGWPLSGTGSENEATCLFLYVVRCILRWRNGRFQASEEDRVFAQPPKRRGVHTFQVLGSGRCIVFELCTVHCRCLLFHAGRPHGDAVAIVTFDPAQHVCPPSQRSERESRNTFS